MKWLAFKNRAKKTILWFKHHWYFPLIFSGLLLAVIVWIVTKNSMYVGLLTDILENSTKSHREEVDKLNEIHSRSTAERAKILREYNKNIEKLEKEYADKGEELDSKKKKEIKKLVEEGYNDPDILSRELAKLYGIEHG